MKIKCPWCDGKSAAVEEQKEEVLQNGNGIVCRCSCCRREFIAIISIPVNTKGKKENDKKDNE